jgi:hypothetical protein
MPVLIWEDIRLTTMLAARLHKTGEPMRLEQVPVPTPRPTDVLVGEGLRRGAEPDQRADPLANLVPGFTNVVIIS